ncbi:Period circadian protein [Penicillium subrubescens]|uniref:GPI anchored cell wall protein n=1 Tax=Penicillium subrubescens TaxID=1316194 RepID=A0A1Q5T6U1_9EURO|nr:Period circadian protein [Penicillium subrubescens]KAJ5875662.1 Period circadian protein [Penicillium subrubescens]OKO95966.1 hypothetical protein PENSUB_10987 [Penicillium subrubescens]
MFFNKSILAVAFVALANLVSAGQTPACLLSVIGNSDNPADLTSLCGSDMKKIESQIADKCGDKTQSALKFYANTCNAAGHQVDISSVTASSSGFVTATATSGSATGTGAFATSTGSRTSGGASSSASGSAAPTATKNAAVGLQFQGTALAAAVFAGAAALL